MVYDGFVDVKVRLSSIVLPVVSINAFGLVMLREVKRAKLSLIVEHVKVIVFRVVVDKCG